MANKITKDQESRIRELLYELVGDNNGDNGAFFGTCHGEIEFEGGDLDKCGDLDKRINTIVVFTNPNCFNDFEYTRNKERRIGRAEAKKDDNDCRSFSVFGKSAEKTIVELESILKAAKERSICE